MMSTVRDCVRLFCFLPGPARKGLGLAAAALIALTAWTGAARAQECTDEGTVKSAQVGDKQVELSFRNASTERRRIYWLDQNGERKFYGVVEPEHVLRQPAFPGFAWVVTDEAEKCLAIVTTSETSATVDVSGATAQVMPPPPGEQEAIAQPQTAAPQEAAADQTPAAPEVSPIEQFELSGAYRLIPPDDPHKALNNESSGGVEITRVQDSWDSAKWTFEEVPDSPYVRIKNEWKKTYLVDRDGKLSTAEAEDDAEEAQWSYEPIDGTPYVQLRNRATENYLLTVDGEPVLAEQIPEKHENRARWDVVSAKQPASQPAAVADTGDNDDDYAAALADCREIGGIWTGSSCRAPEEEQVLDCRPGWRWSSEDGECEWAGRGDCPPWQMRRGRCLADLTCAGGVVRRSGRGLSCRCPIGMAAWGRYPNFRCVPSIVRILPLLQQGKLRSGNNRKGKRRGKGFGNKQFGNQQFFGNKQFGGGKGQRPGKGKGKGNKGPANANNNNKNNVVPPPIVKQIGQGKPTQQQGNIPANANAAAKAAAAAAKAKAAALKAQQKAAAKAKAAQQKAKAAALKAQQKAAAQAKKAQQAAAKQKANALKAQQKAAAKAKAAALKAQKKAADQAKKAQQAAAKQKAKALKAQQKAAAKAAKASQQKPCTPKRKRKGRC